MLDLPLPYVTLMFPKVGDSSTRLFSTLWCYSYFCRLFFPDVLPVCHAVILAYHYFEHCLPLTDFLLFSEPALLCSSSTQNPFSVIFVGFTVWSMLYRCEG